MPQPPLPLIERPGVTARPPGGVRAARSIDLPCDPAQVAVARRFLDANLRTPFPALVEDAVLVGSELATNAVCHAPSPRGLTVAWDALPDGGVRISVADGSTVQPRREPPSDTAEEGRGLDLVAGLSSAWGIRLEPDGKVVFAELREGGPPPTASAASGWQVRATWRVLDPGVAHPETTSEDRRSEWAALVHASWLARSEGASAVVQIVRIEIRDPATGVWRAVHDPGSALDAVAEVALLRAAGRADTPGEGSAG